MSQDESWEKIFQDYDILNHNFHSEPFFIKNNQIKKSCQNFLTTGEKEVRLLCKQDSREKRPQIFRDHNLFILPVKNGEYAILKGEGYVDIPEIITEENLYTSILNYKLDTSLVGNSEMQHLDFAYASSLIRTFMEDDTLVLTIRGRKYTPEFTFKVANYNIVVKGVQTEVDAGYEGKEQVVLIEAKNSQVNNTIIRQLYYPFRQWQKHTNKQVVTLFFEKKGDTYSIWRFDFRNIEDYNSINMVKSGKFKVINGN